LLSSRHCNGIVNDCRRLMCTCFIREGADPVIQVLDSRSTFHRTHMQYQCEQQLEWVWADS